MARKQIRWIVSPAYDLTFFIGAVTLTFAFLGLYEGLKWYGLAPSGPAALLTYFVFTTFIDLPHIFQTFSRTHADPDEFARRKHLYTWGLPLLMAVGLVIPFLAIEDVFVAFMALYGSHHIVRQHVGFVKIYQGLNEPYQPVDRVIDRLAIELGLYACIFHDYVVEGPGFLFQEPVYGSLFATFPRVPAPLGHLLAVLAWLAVGVFLARQLQLLWLGRPVNVPKVLLMLAALTSHYVVFVIATVPFLVAEAIETAYHDAQYHGWVAHYQRRRFPGVKRVALKWLGASLLYGLIAGVIETIGYTNPLFYWIFAPLGMLTLFHYYIDGRIWRLRDCPELRTVVFGPSPVATAPAEPVVARVPAGV